MVTPYRGRGREACVRVLISVSDDGMGTRSFPRSVCASNVAKNAEICSLQNKNEFQHRCATFRKQGCITVKQNTNTQNNGALWEAKNNIIATVHIHTTAKPKQSTTKTHYGKHNITTHLTICVRFAVNEISELSPPSMKPPHTNISSPTHTCTTNQ